MDFLREYADVMSAILDFAIVVLLVLQIRRLRLGFPHTAIAALVFFILRGFSRLNDQASIWPRHYADVELVLDVASVIVLIYIVANVPRLARAVLAVVDESRFRGEEYERALRHYTQVVHHRMLNPVTVIKGSAQTLKTGAVVDPSIHEQLCDVIISMADEVQHVTLQPERRDSLERDLDAVPHVDRRAASR